MKTILLNQIPHLVDGRFDGYTFVKKPSSNVYCMGFTQHPVGTPDNVVIQFNNGGTYLYEGVPAETIQGAIDCDSIGKYYRAEISGKHTGVKLDKQAVTAVKEEGVQCTN